MRRATEEISERASTATTPEGSFISITERAERGLWVNGQWMGVQMSWTTSEPLPSKIVEKLPGKGLRTAWGQVSPDHGMTGWDFDGTEAVGWDSNSRPLWNSDMDPQQWEVEAWDALWPLSKQVHGALLAAAPAVENQRPWETPILKKATEASFLEEIANVSWTPENVDRWWRLVQGLLWSPPVRDVSTSSAWSVGSREREGRTFLPLEIPTDRHLIYLGRALPYPLRKPGRLNGLVNKAGNGGASWSGAESVLRSWCSPSRFWSLRKKFFDLARSFEVSPGGSVYYSSEQIRNDILRLPGKTALKVLDQSLERLRSDGNTQWLSGFSFAALPSIQAAFPEWSGWNEVLGRLKAIGTPTPEVTLLASELSQRALDLALPAEDSPSPPRSRPRM